MKTLLGLLVLIAPAAAQSFNVDIGVTFGTPLDTYGAAAGQAGPWNQVAVLPPVMTPIALTDTTGAAGIVTVEYNKLGAGMLSFDNILTTGDDEALLDDFIDVGQVIKFTFKNLQAGTYDVYTYAWAPDDPTGYITGVEVIGGVNGAIQPCGGADWTGVHVLGQTYVKDTFVLTPGADLKVRYTPITGFGTGNGIQVVQVGGACSGNATTYCTAGTSASGCQALLSASGIPSATAPSGFVLSALSAEGGNKSGLIYFGATQKLPATQIGSSSSFQCVNPPVKRSQLLDGAGTNGFCDGFFSMDVNARWTAQPAQNPGAGATVFAQLWYRDPVNTSNQTTSRSDAVTFTTCP